MVRRKCATPHAELRFLQLVQTERIKPTTPLHATPCALEVNMVLPHTRLPILLVQQGRFSETFAEQTTRAGYRVELRTQSVKANSQSMADKLLHTSKRIIRYVLCIPWQEWPWRRDSSAFTLVPETHRSSTLVRRSSHRR